MSNHLTKKILFQSAPTLVSQLLINANTIIDTVMVGHVSAIQLASLGIGMNIYIALYVPCMGILLALIPLISSANGNQDYRRVASLMKQGKYLAFLLSLLSILVMLFPGLLLSIMQSSSEFNHTVRQYLIATSIGMPAILLFQVYFAFFSCMLRPIIAMFINLLSILIKVILNVVLIYGVLPEAMSATGCALATSMVSWVTILIGYLVIRRHPEFAPYRAFGKMVSFNFKEQWKILKIGIPVGINFSIDSLFFTLTTLLIAQFGTSNAAANQIVCNLSYSAYLIPFSIANVSTVLIAERLGAGDQKTARKIGTSALKLGLITHLVLAALFIFFNRSFALLYTSDTTIIPLASILIILMGCYRFFDSLLVLLGGILRGYRKTTIPTLIYAITLWPIGFGMGYYLAFYSGIVALNGVAGFWFALIFSAFSACCLVLPYYKYISLKQRPDLPEGAVSNQPILH